MMLISRIIGDQWRGFAVLIVLGAIAGGLYTLSIKYARDLLEGSGGLDELIFIGIAMTGSSFLAIFSGRRMTHLYEHRVSELRVSLCNKVMNADFKSIEGDSHKIVPVLMAEVNALTAFFKSVPAAIVAFFQVIGIMAYMIWISWKLSLIIMMIFSVVFTFNYVFLRRIYGLNKFARDLNVQLHYRIEGMVSGIKELVLNQRHNKSYINEIIQQKSHSYADYMTRLASINVLLSKVSEWIVIISLSLLIYFVNNGRVITPTEFMSFFMLAIFLLPSLIIITTFSRSIKRMQTSVEKIEELGLNFESKAVDRVIEESFDQGTQTSRDPLIRVDGISYVYNKGKRDFTIGPISLDIYPNETICFTGGNGSGKTSVIKLITGLYQTVTGGIYYKNQLVDEYHLQSYRNLFSASFADSHVFQEFDYLKNSKMLGRSQELIKTLELENKISIEDFKITDVNLSFGQRGRLNLLRTILEDKPIMVFDEWAANQDPYFKDKFYNQLVPMLKEIGKTVILVSHDDKYYHIADRIVRLREGRVDKIIRTAD